MLTKQVNFIRKLRAQYALAFLTFFFFSLPFNSFNAIKSAGYWALFLELYLLNVISFVSNDYFDRKEDYKDMVKRKRNIFCQKKDFQKNKRLLLILAILPVPLMFLGRINMISGILFYTIMIVYAHPMFKLKGKPFLDVLIHAVWFSTIFTAGWVYAVPIDKWYYTLLTSIIFYSTAVQLGQEVRDYDVDKETGMKTTVFYIGKDLSAKISWVLYRLFYVIIIAVYSYFFFGKIFK